MILKPGLRKGVVTPPPSKSHLHRLLIADFLAGDTSRLTADDADSADIVATKRCLRALAEPTATPVLDCGESGSTLRFMAPLAAALGKTPTFQMAGRLAVRPMKTYANLQPGVQTLAGNISSQFVTGLLFALPLLKGDSQIRFTSPLESRGYVALTLAVLRGAGIVIYETAEGYEIPGHQVYCAQPQVQPEADWSGAAFWLVAHAMGNQIEVKGLNEASVQPDRRIVDAIPCRALNMSEFPDSFPILTILAASRFGETVFTGIERLRLKESDRVAAMADVLTRLGVATEVSATTFRVKGTGAPFRGGAFTAFDDHRIAMSIAIAATRAAAEIELDNPACAAKSYPTFFTELNSFDIIMRNDCAD